MAQRVLITGGAGFVGTSLALQWKNAHPQSKIVSLDNLRRRGSESNLARLKQAGVEFVHGDIRCRDDLFDLPGQFDLVIDAAAEPSVLAGVDGSPSYVLDSNLNGTLNTLEFARRRSAGFVFLSTSRVYSIPALTGLPLEEKDTRFEVTDSSSQTGSSARGIRETFSTDGYRSLYGSTKLAAELILQEYVHTYGLKAVINRCGVICGPGQFGKSDQGVFTYWLASHLLGQPLKYTGFGGTGKQVRDLLHPSDLFSLIELQSENLSAHAGKIYNVGGGAEGSVSLLEWTRLCEDATEQQCEISSEPKAHKVDIAYYVSDNSAVTAATGWKPTVRPAQIAKAIVHWLRDNPNLARTLLGLPLQPASVNELNSIEAMRSQQHTLGGRAPGVQPGDHKPDASSH